jgi:hypothetical protein
MAVTGVFAEAHVRNEDQFFSSFRLLKSMQRLLHNSVFLPGPRSLLILGFRQPEEKQAAHPQPRRFFGFAHRFVDRDVEDAGHGAHRAPHTPARANKERVNQVAGLNCGFAHQRAQGFAAPQAAHAHLRKTHDEDCRRSSTFITAHTASSCGNRAA